MNLDEAFELMNSKRQQVRDCFEDLSAHNLAVWIDLAEAAAARASNDELAHMVSEAGLSDQEVEYLAACTKRYANQR
jgi:predicted component of type VI protein secretion system